MVFVQSSFAHLTLRTGVTVSDTSLPLRNTVNDSGLLTDGSTIEIS